MKKLKSKIFIVIFLILTLVTTAVLAVHNVQLYSQQKQIVERSLNETLFDRIDDMMQMPRMKNNNGNDNGIGNFRFMDSTVYTVLLNSDNSVSSIINHSFNSNYDEDELAEIAQNLISEGKEQKTGNLYFDNYSYKFESGSYITIVDNTSANSFLRNALIMSLLLYLIIEFIIALIALKLSVWIAKPVAESFDKQKQFIADASHELKTPLSVIIASADALESNPTETKWLNNIKSESDRMNRLIADLLELAKSEEVNDKSEFAQGSLSKTVEMSALTFEGVMFEKGIMLNTDIENGIDLNMNVFKIKQLMSILLDNAIKHSQIGGKIDVSLKREKDIILSVTNKGEGIPQGEEEKIFERFYRVDESRNRNENRYGLGLAIAKNIAESHGASISAKSENGVTTFKVIFKN